MDQGEIDSLAVQLRRSVGLPSPLPRGPEIAGDTMTVFAPGEYLLPPGKKLAFAPGAPALAVTIRVIG